jgi:hypothetical protein
MGSTLKPVGDSCSHCAINSSQRGPLRGDKNLKISHSLREWIGSAGARRLWARGVSLKDPQDITGRVTRLLPARAVLAIDQRSGEIRSR